MKDYEIASRDQILRFGRGSQVYTESAVRNRRRRAEIKEIVTSECSILISFAWLAVPKQIGEDGLERWSYSELGMENRCTFLHYSDLVVVNDQSNSITYANLEEQQYVMLASQDSPFWLPPHLLLNYNPPQMH